MESILDRLSTEQSSFALEDQPIVDLLESWLTSEEGKNVGRDVTTAVLCQELADLAIGKRIEFKFQGRTRSFAQYLRNFMGTLREVYDIRRDVFRKK